MEGQKCIVYWSRAYRLREKAIWQTFYNDPPPIPYENFVEGIRHRGMDHFTANGPQIIVDTTDFAKVDKKELLEKIKYYCKGERI